MKSFLFTINNKINTVKNINVDKALIEGYEHNKDLYKLLLDDEDTKKRILGIYMEEIYKKLQK